MTILLYILWNNKLSGQPAYAEYCERSYFKIRNINPLLPVRSPDPGFMEMEFKLIKGVCFVMLIL